MEIIYTIIFIGIGVLVFDGIELIDLIFKKEKKKVEKKEKEGFKIYFEEKDFNKKFEFDACS